MTLCYRDYGGSVMLPLKTKNPTKVGLEDIDGILITE